MGFEVNFHFLLLPKFMAKSPGCRDEAQIFESGRVQLVRQGADILRYFQDLFPQVVHASAKFGRTLGEFALQELHSNRQHCQALVGIVMKFSGDPGPFQFLGLNQPPTYAGQSLFRQFAVGDVLERAVKSDDRTVPEGSTREMSMSGIPLVAVPARSR